MIIVGLGVRDSAIVKRDECLGAHLLEPLSDASAPSAPFAQTFVVVGSSGDGEDRDTERRRVLLANAGFAFRLASIVYTLSRGACGV